MADVSGLAPKAIEGTVAHDAAVSGNPVLISGRANANEPTAVADGDASHLWLDTWGRPVVVLSHPSPEAPDISNITASGDTQLIAAPGAGVSLYIVRGSVHNQGSAQIIAGLRDGAGGTRRWQAPLAADGGGSLIDFGSRGWKLSANTALAGDIDAAGDVYFNITEYYIAP